MRVSWDDYFMKVAEDVSTRSTCLKRKVGAVVVRDKRILTTGYNGAMPGFEHCLDIGCRKREMGSKSGGGHSICRAIHAEQNAIVQAAKFGIALENSEIFIFGGTPCIHCARLLVATQIHTVTCKGTYPDDYALEILNEATIRINIME